MKLHTLLDLSEKVTPKYANYAKLLGDSFFKELPLYGKLYNITFNNQDANMFIDFYKNLIEVHGTNKHLELFSGNAVESSLLASKYPEKQFYGIDIDHSYFTKRELPNLHYLKGDCIVDDGTLSDNSFDMLFCGAINASHCVIPSMKTWFNHMDFVKRKLREGGIFVMSFFDSDFVDNHTFDISESVTEIQYCLEEPQYNGKFAHWVTASYMNLQGGYHDYYNMVVVCNDFEGKEPIEGLYNVKGSRFYSHNTAAVLGIAKDYGFTMLDSHDEFDTRTIALKLKK